MKTKMFVFIFLAIISALGIVLCTILTFKNSSIVSLVFLLLCGYMLGYSVGCIQELLEEKQ